MNDDFSPWKCSLRQLYHFIIQGTQQKIIPVYLHLATKDNVQWFQQSSNQILSELCDVLLDNLDLMQQQVVEQQENDTRWNLYRLRGEKIAIAYKIQQRTERSDTILIQTNEMDVYNYQAIQKASFVLNPLYVFPYGTYPLLPGPTKSKISTSSTTITDYYKIAK